MQKIGIIDTVAVLLIAIRGLRATKTGIVDSIVVVVFYCNKRS